MLGMSAPAGSRIIELLMAAGSGQTTVEVPGSGATSVQSVLRHVSTLAVELDHLGIRYPDRVALVGTNGAAFLAAFFAATTRTTCAPLNPAYTVAEFELYLTDLDAGALLLVDGASPAAADAATRLGIPVIAVGTAGDGGDTFEPGEVRSESEVALVLHTSGTTSRSKIVPLTHANLCASARNISRALDLGSSDRYLNVMPWFHVHGLLAALATLRSGGTVICPAAFHAGLLLEWLRDLRPTWYSAVPSMHAAVADRMVPGAAATNHALRFIRSGSAPLAPGLMARLEALFEVPVIEFYGMTEAANQITSNPLPPARRKPGSVGRPEGPAVAIAEATGRLIGAGEIGEVVVRGENVTSGYENHPGNQAFHGQWLRTGDLGYLDEDGYLFLAGRLKEMINRGGEKIAPREIEEALLDHAGVAQAAAFAVPHVRLGEDVGAAVVIKPGYGVTERELRQHVAARLAPFKVPRVLRLVNDIPTGATGKVQRLRLATALGIPGVGAAAGRQPDVIEPSGPVETVLAGLWCDLLKLEHAGTLDDFFVSGGDSLAVAQLLERVRDEFDLEVSIAVFLEEPTIAGLARFVEGHRVGRR
jgi:acyl-CoA synthetase (AMP-forming)/AMP-acid ligase II/acyl carrier protein